MTAKERMIEKLGSEEAYKEHMRAIARKAKTTTHGFSNPDVVNKAIDASLKARGLKRRPVDKSR